MIQLYRILIIFVCFLTAFFLQELPYHFSLQKLLPEWPFLFTLFFLVNETRYFPLFMAFVIGLLEDVFLEAPLGLHALIYTCLGYLFMFFFYQLRGMSMLMQASIIAFLVFLKVLIVFIYSAIAFGMPSYYTDFISIFFSFFAWLLLCYLFVFFFDMLYRN